MSENTDSLISFSMKIWKYLQHGFALGVLGFGFILIGFFIPYLVYPVMLMLGLPLSSALFFGVIFMLLGGVNQIMAQRLWGVEIEQSIGTGMRDGFFLFVLINISFAPLILVMNSMWLLWVWTWHPINPLDVFIILLISTPVYLLLMGLIGEKVAIFLHVEKEPEMPANSQERSQKCPYCGSSYYYSPDKVSEGEVQCQNCAKKFPVISDI
jgi:hypothetical protein